MDSPAVSTHTGAANTRLKSRPTTAPISVSSTRSQAWDASRVTPRTSIALIATSLTNSSTRTNCPIVRDARMIRPRLHHERPIRELNPIAISTPTTTEFTRRMLVFRVE